MIYTNKQNKIRVFFEIIGYIAAIVTIITFVMPNKGLIIIRRIEKTLEEHLPAPINAQIKFLELFQFNDAENTMLRYYNLSRHTGIKKFEIHLFHIENNKPVFIYKYEDHYLGNDAVRNIDNIGITKRLYNKVIMCINYKYDKKIELTPLTAKTQNDAIVYMQESKTKIYSYELVTKCKEAVNL